MTKEPAEHHPVPPASSSGPPLAAFLDALAHLQAFARDCERKISAPCSLPLRAASLTPQVLVLLDSPSLEASHSAFLAGLRSRGYELDVKPIDDKSLQLKSWDEWLYDKLLILGSSKGEAG